MLLTYIQWICHRNGFGRQLHQPMAFTQNCRACQPPASCDLAASTLYKRQASFFQAPSTKCPELLSAVKSMLRHSLSLAHKEAQASNEFSAPVQ
mmetsp:Transcript_106239/g.188889  ORF Transcript_106239/g.188889 Transcript_106239/m.188889 type:complete len:94 (+) Transcript_106239:110-391(+)